MGTGAAIGIAAVLLVGGLAGGYVLGTSYGKSSTSTSTTQVTETGSSLLYPLMKIWGPNYTKSYEPNVVLAPASTGSGAGQTGAETGTVDIGASDGYLSNASANGVINVPAAISAQLVYYNLPTVTGHLNLNGTILAMIYEGTIATWNNPLILAAQSSAVQAQLNGLSSQTIWTLKRADASGDTFLFTSLCYMSWKGWTYNYSTSALSGLTGPHVLSETGNSGMVSGVSGQVGSIAYIGISYESLVTTAGVSYAAVGDNNSLSASGGIDPANYILPNATTISQDANLGLTHLQFSTYQLAVSLILGGSPAGAIALKSGAGGTAPSASSPTPYPLVNLEYCLIKTTNRPDSLATVLFLQWAISFGNLPQYLSPVGFVPLTPEVIGYDMQELATVQI